jgi:magnesium chelatase accessory protein
VSDAAPRARSVPAAGLRWQVRQGGAGPLLVLLHGTGASAHSFDALLPALLPQATVLVPDLPGHGGTRGAGPADLTLPRIAQGLQALVQALGLPAPAAVVGHSAGAALGLRWALDLQAAGAVPPVVLGFAPSLVAPPAFYTQWMAPLVNPVATSGWMTSAVARLGRGTALVDWLLNSTGSQLDPAQRAAYRALFSDPEHVRGAVGFMAAADLPALLAECPRLRSDTAFVLGTRDTWVPQRMLAPVIARALPRARVQVWPLGHLLHEEDPARAAAWVLEQLPWRGATGGVTGAGAATPAAVTGPAR